MMEPDHGVVKNAPPSVNSASVPFVVAVLACTYHVLLTVLVNYIPDPAFAAGMTAYALVGAVLSTLGFVGVTWKRPRLISCFATFLLVDALVAVVSRLLILWVLMNAMFTEIWSVCMATASAGLEDLELMEINPKHDIVTSARWQREHVIHEHQQCGWAINTIQLMMMGVIIGMTILQASLGMGIRRFGKEMQRRQQEERDLETASTSEKLGLDCA